MSARLELDRLGERRFARRTTTRRDPDPGAPAMVGRVVSPADKIALKKFLLVRPVTVLGAECEGCAPTLTPRTATIPVLLLGPRVAAPGDDLVCRFVGHRWVAEKTGGGSSYGAGVVLPTCSCPVPRVLRMTSRDPKCNYGMFQSCTLVYGPPRPEMAAFGLRNPCFTSAETFTDPISKCDFYYYWECSYNQFFLTRIFPVSPISSPYRDGILYAWVVGGYKNTCNPFYLYNGTAFPGSDASCSLSVEG